MAAAAINMTEQDEPLAAADFQALEERVFRAVELLKTEREAHAAANARIADLEHRNSDLESQLAGHGEDTSRLQGELQQLQQERDHVRSRVERLLKHLDEFTA